MEVVLLTDQGVEVARTQVTVPPASEGRLQFSVTFDVSLDGLSVAAAQQLVSNLTGHVLPDLTDPVAVEAWLDG